MFKFTIVIFAVIACAAANPGLLAPLAYSSPLVAAAPGIVTATSSQVIARNYNGIAAAPVAVAAPIAAKVVAAPLAYSAPLVAAPYAKYVSAPLAVAPAAYGYAAAPLAAKYVSPLSYAAPAPYFI